MRKSGSSSYKTLLYISSLTEIIIVIIRKFLFLFTLNLLDMPWKLGSAPCF